MEVPSSFLAASSAPVPGAPVKTGEGPCFFRQVVFRSSRLERTSNTCLAQTGQRKVLLPQVLLLDPNMKQRCISAPQHIATGTASLLASVGFLALKSMPFLISKTFQCGASSPHSRNPRKKGVVFQRLSKQNHRRLWFCYLLRFFHMTKPMELDMKSGSVIHL